MKGKNICGTIRVVRGLAYYLVMMSKNNKKFVPVLFVLLSEVNETDWTKLERQAAMFLRKMGWRTKVHLRAPGGLEKHGNTHAHLIVEVAEDEVGRFWNKYPTFDAQRCWSHRKMECRTWEPGHKTYAYTTEKHERWWDMYCPRKYRGCRRGDCSHF